MIGLAEKFSRKFSDEPLICIRRKPISQQNFLDYFFESLWVSWREGLIQWLRSAISNDFIDSHVVNVGGYEGNALEGEANADSNW